MNNRRIVLFAFGILVVVGLAVLLDYQERGARRGSEGVADAASSNAQSLLQDQRITVWNSTLNNRVDQNITLNVRQKQTTITQHVQVARADRVEVRPDVDRVAVNPVPVVLPVPAPKVHGLEWSGPITRLRSAPGSKIRLDGTANLIHTTWWVEGEFIAGALYVGPGFPTQPGQTVSPGQVQAQTTNVFLQVRSLKSIEKDGKLYSDEMDQTMYRHLKVEKYPSIRYRLAELAFKEAPMADTDPYVFDSKGELAVAGITNTLSMPINVLPLGNGKLKISGSTILKMSDYKAGPVEEAIHGLGVRTGDEVKVSFEWMLAAKASTQ